MALDIFVCSRYNLIVTMGIIDVAGFAIVIPCRMVSTMVLVSGQDGKLTGDDLDKVRLDLKNLLPAIIPERLARTIPVLVPLRKIYLQS